MAIQDDSLAISNKQHAVPQNVMDVEFKLIGDLTMRQFSYLLIFGLLAYLNFAFVLGILRLPFTLIFALAGVMLAFVPVQERGMDQWVINFFKAIYSPHERIWKKVPDVPSAFMYDSINVIKQELITLAPTSNRRKLEEFLDYQKQVAPRDPLDINADAYILKVRQAYGSVTKTSPAVIAATYAAPTSAVTPAPVTTVVSEPIPAAPSVPVSTLITPPSPVSAPVSTAPVPTPKPMSTPVSKPAPSYAQTVQKYQQKIGAGIESISPVVKSMAGSFVKQLTNLKMETAPARPRPVSDTFTVSPITPDRHAGRRFVSFLPSEGELILPVRGERILKTSEQIEIEQDMNEKAARLQTLLGQIQGTSNISNAVPAPKPMPKPVPQAIPQTQVRPQSQVQPQPQVSRVQQPAQKLPPIYQPTPRPTPVSNQTYVPKPIPTPSPTPMPRPVQRPIQPTPIATAPTPPVPTSTPLSTPPISQRPPVSVPSTPRPVVNVANIPASTEKKSAGILVNPNAQTQTPGFVPPVPVEQLIKKVSEEELEEPISESVDITEHVTPIEPVSKAAQNNPELLESFKNLQKDIFYLQEKVKQFPSNLQNRMSSSKKPAAVSAAPANIISGSAKTLSGDPIEGIVIIFKNSAGDPIRATKTNALGQFVLTSPLPNGTYMVEVSSTNNNGLSFDIISLEAKGDVIPPLELIGK
jgi:hypothetical protein